MIERIFAELQLQEIMSVVWLLLPAAFANLAPVFSKFLFPNWNTPIDFGLTYHGNIIFGSHKTYRGFISGILAGAAVFSIQKQLYTQFQYIQELCLFDYSSTSAFFGAWIGFWALLGDLVKSFFKRRMQIAPGNPWIPFDESDWIIGAFVGMTVKFLPTVQIIVIGLFLFIGLHFLINYVGFRFGFKNTPI